MKLMKYMLIFVFSGIVLSSNVLGKDKAPEPVSEAPVVDNESVKRRNGIMMDVYELIPKSYKPPVIENKCNITERTLDLSNGRMMDLMKECDSSKVNWARLNK